MAELRRWKSTHGQRLEALEGLYRTAQQEAAGAAETIATLASERAANALLTEQVRQLELAEEGAKEAFGHVVQQKHDAEAECKRLRELLEAAQQQIRCFYMGTPESRLAAAHARIAKLEAKIEGMDVVGLAYEQREAPGPFDRPGAIGTPNAWLRDFGA